MEDVEEPVHYTKRDLLLEINPCRGTVRIDLLDEEEDDFFHVTQETVDVESLADVERYQCFTFPEESWTDLTVDKISMTKTPRDSISERRRFDWSEEACELGPQIYTLKITTGSEEWGDAENVQATIVFSGNTNGHKTDVPHDLGAADLYLGDDTAPEALVSGEDSVSEDDSVPIDKETEEYYSAPEEGEDDYDATKEEPASDDFVVEEADEFLLHNLKHIGKVECMFVTKATDEVWQFHEIRVTRVKPKKKVVASTEDVHFKPVSRVRLFK